MISENGRLFGKINILDLIIVLIMISLLGLITYSRYFQKETVISPVVIDTAKQAYIIEFYSEQIPDYVAEALAEGDIVYELTRNIYMGTINGIEIENGYVYYPDNQGVLHKSDKEGYKAVKLTIETMALSSLNGINLSGLDFQVGQDLTIRAGKTRYYTKISAIEEN